MEDSGIDSDAKQSSMQREETDNTSCSASGNKIMKNSSQLQQKIERQREVNRKFDAISDQPKRGILSRQRLRVPPKPVNRTPANASGADTQPLVMIESDESEDEFAVPRLSRQAQREITQQLIKDGYNLDLEPDDEDLDLIPPRPVHERWVCCSTAYACNTQQCVIQ